MLSDNRLLHFKKELSSELTAILHWWMKKMVDRINGGFYGKIDGSERLHPEADKGVILNTRILWAFSSAAYTTDNQQYTKIADQSYNYIENYFHDKINSGLYWMLNYKGQPVQMKKQIYAQAFGIYGLAEYYHLTKKEAALQLAMDLFENIEKYSLDALNGGYFEAFTKDWQPAADLRLSDKDVNEAKTMNTHLHILEAYTTLYRIAPQERIHAALQTLIECFLKRFINFSTKHLNLFFDEKWTLKSDAVSYGHDIEASWLLYEAAVILGNESLLKTIEKTALDMAGSVLKKGFDETGGIMYEKNIEHPDKEKHWWVQAEAVIGFFNAYELSGDKRFLSASINTWQFIQNYIIDKEKGEWYWSVTEKGEINAFEDKAGPWKAPYHNTRMCMEIVRRIEKIQFC